MGARMRGGALAAAVAVMLGLAGACGGSGSPDHAGSAPSSSGGAKSGATSGGNARATVSERQSYDDAIPPEVRANASDWPLPGRDYSNSRAATSLIDASDIGTLEVAWRAPMPGSGVFGNLATTPTDGIDIQPTVFGGLVLVSTVPISVEGQYKGGDRGILHALDAKTGEDVWTFDTVASHDLWGKPGINSGGGAWYPPSIDPASGTVYWGIGNPAPFPGAEGYPNGTSRPGPDLFTDSVVALEARSGRLRWYRQAVEHDLFDHDLMHTLVVPVETAGGRSRNVVVGTGKLGRVIGHDPATGQVLWDTPVGVHRNDDLTALDGPTEILPGTFGGVLTPPAAADGTVYVATLNAPTTLIPSQASLVGGTLGSADGELVAIEAATGKVVWDTDIPGDPLGAATVVNDLVLTATFQGHLYALDRATGRIVMDRDMGGGINGWLAVVGDTILVPVGMADPPSLVALRLPRG